MARILASMASSRTQGHAHDLGDHVPGDVVLGRPEAAAHDDGVGPLEGVLAGRCGCGPGCRPPWSGRRSRCRRGPAARRSSDELVSTIWPSSSSVPTATTSQFTPCSPFRRSPCGSRRCRAPGGRPAVVRRLPARKYCQPVTSVSTTAMPQQERGRQPLLAGPGRHPATSAVPTARRLHQRLELGPLASPAWPGRGGRSGCGSMLMPSSRAADERDRQPPERVDRHQHEHGPETRTLSASGSRKAPERVVPWRRAIQPSTPSVAASATQSAERRPATPSVGDHGEQERRDQQADDGDEVGRGGAGPTARRRSWSPRARAPRTRPPSGARRPVTSPPGPGPGRRRSRPSTNSPTGRSSGTRTTPSISGASR